MPEASLIHSFLEIAPFMILVGGFAGLLAGLFGIGGGLIIVPALYFFLGGRGVEAPTAMALAIGTSLASIIPTSLASSRAHHRLGNVEWTLVRIWAPFVILGVVVGALIVSQVRSQAFVVSFSLLLALVAGNKLLGEKLLVPLSSMPSFHIQKAVATAIGFVSAIAGVGGGTTSVPALVYFGLPMHRAVGTSAALGVLIAVPGTLGLLFASSTPEAAPQGTFRLIYLPALVLIVPLTIVFAPLGARLAALIPEKWLKKAFAAVLVCVALRMLFTV